MGSKMVRLEDDVYERLFAEKGEDETFSEAVERLLGGPSLHSLAGILDDEEAEQFREAVDSVDETATEDVDELVDRFDGTAE
jgi:predicted CopG family antitoxin